MAKPRILMIAEAANPEWVSVPAVGWNHYRAVAKLADVHLVTQVRNLEGIRRFGLDEADFTAIDSEPMARPLHRLTGLIRGGSGKGWTTGMALFLASYWYFERQMWARFRDRIRAGEFDVVHRVTPLSPTMPSWIAIRCRRAGVPFVIGPLNGGVPWPRWFDRERRSEREWLSYVRGAYRLVPGYRSTLECASAIVAGSRDTAAQVPRRYREKLILMPENGIDPERFAGFSDRSVNTPLRLAFVGRLVPYKGADMAIEAAAPLIRAGRARLSIVGEGPERGRLEGMIRELGLAGGVAMLGWLSQEAVGRHLAESDLFVFPSIREFGGGVVLEAMALGCPPVVVDYGGPRDLVTPESGFSVPIGPRDSVVSGVRRVLEDLDRDPGRLSGMRRSAHERVLRLFTWDAKAAQMMRVYRWVMEGQGPAPEFGFVGDAAVHAADSRVGAMA